MKNAVFSFERREILGAFTAGAMASVVIPAGVIAALASGSGRRVSVPLDHFRPGEGQVELEYEWGAPYRSELPTVLLVADAQQFYVRPGAAADLQAKLFGPNLNVLALFGRASSPMVLDFVRPNGAVDWTRAARVLNIHQWIADIRSAVDALGLQPRQLGLYGRSGGADLVLRFLAMYPARAGRAYVQAAVTHDLAARWGLSADHFWEQLTNIDPKRAERLASYLVNAPQARREAVLLLQRQNFYEALDNLSAARAALIDTIVSQDRVGIADFRRRYQLDAIEALHAKGENLSPVRLHEFSRAYDQWRKTAAPIRPDIESIFYYAEPVDRALYDVNVPTPPPGLEGLRQTTAEVLIVAGRHDHTADYRAQIGLAGLLPRSELLLLDDDHVFKRLGSSGHHAALLQGFFSGGLASPAFKSALRDLAPLKWDEIH